MSMRPHEPLPEVANEVDALLRGDPAPLVASFQDLRIGMYYLVQRLWWEISTLYGQVAGHIDAQWGERRYSPSFACRPVRTTGGPPREVVNLESLIHDWRTVLGQPPSRELHRRNMAETLASLRAGAHPQPDSADALLRHHTELPVDTLVPLGDTPKRQHVGTGPHERPEWEAVLDLLPLAPVLESQEAFDAHVRAGLDSPSLPRRDLCWRLARL